MTSTLTEASHTSVLAASRDPATGELYVPAREFSADGTLRRCEPLHVTAEGILVAATEYAGVVYAIIDLKAGPRIQAVLTDGPRRLGAVCFGRDSERGEVIYACV